MRRIAVLVLEDIRLELYRRPDNSLTTQICRADGGTDWSAAELLSLAALINFHVPKIIAGHSVVIEPEAGDEV